MGLDPAAPAEWWAACFPGINQPSEHHGNGCLNVPAGPPTPPQVAASRHPKDYVLQHKSGHGCQCFNCRREGPAEARGGGGKQHVVQAAGGAAGCASDAVTDRRQRSAGVVQRVGRCQALGFEGLSRSHGSRTASYIPAGMAGAAAAACVIGCDTSGGCKTTAANVNSSPTSTPCAHCPIRLLVSLADSVTQPLPQGRKAGLSAAPQPSSPTPKLNLGAVGLTVAASQQLLRTKL